MNGGQTETLAFTVTPYEKRTILRKMKECGIIHISAYLRKAAMDGIIVNLDMRSVREACSLMRKISGNIDRLNEKFKTGNRDMSGDFEQIKSRQDELMKKFASVIQQMSEII